MNNSCNGAKRHEHTARHGKLLCAVALIFMTALSPVASAMESFLVTNVGVDLEQQTIFVHVNHAASGSSCAVTTIFKWSLSMEGVHDVLALATTALREDKAITIEVSPSGTCVNSHVTGKWVRLDD